jgi:peptidoglycan/LPS O-acetylase OafA/YrhL
MNAVMTKSRFVVLDGIRGMAAIAVMLYHLFPNVAGGFIYHSYLAVDLFFLLSGFVIALTYEQKLHGTLSLGGFIITRAIRLYPLVFAAVISVAFIRLLYPIPTLPAGSFLYQLSTNLLLIPNSLNREVEKFIFVPPSWSLFYEMAVNIMYAACVPLLGRKWLHAVIVIMGALLAAIIYAHGSVMLLHQNIFFGFPRAIFSFCLGVLIYRGYSTGFHTKIAVPLIVQYLAILTILVLPSIDGWNWLYDILAIFLVFPAIITVAVQQTSTERRTIESELGEMSYPIYVLHMPVLAYTGVALGWAGNDRVIASAAAVLTLIAAALAWRLYDRPLRAWLSARLYRPNLQRNLRAEP